MNSLPGQRKAARAPNEGSPCGVDLVPCGVERDAKNIPVHVCNIGRQTLIGVVPDVSNASERSRRALGGGMSDDVAVSATNPTSTKNTNESTYVIWQAHDSVKGAVQV